jgi:APA family basic amino acid/polyamine antiporter
VVISQIRMGGGTGGFMSGKEEELRREVTVWGSYMWGFADVGADVFVAMGLVFAAAQGATPLVFAIAGGIYILIGLAYTELASAYPVAGGGQYFSARGLGDIWGLVAGSALLLDYTIDIALFATASAGYLNFFLPYLFGVGIDRFAMDIGPFKGVNPLWCGETLLIIAVLTWLNVKGIRESSRVNEIIGVVVIASEVLLILLGFAMAWHPSLFVQQWKHEFPSAKDFMYGSSIAIISFVGLESISQAAQETRRPATIIPRTSIALIFTVFLFAVSIALLSLGILPWKQIAARVDSPLAVIAEAVPYIGPFAAPLIASLGTIMLFISANSGIMSASRLTYSMSKFRLISKWFDAVHPTYRTPMRSILVFSGIGALQTILAFLSRNAMDVLANLYAFGASLGYLLVFISLFALRIKDPYTPRPYKVPLNLSIKRRDGIRVEIPVLGILGIIGVGSIIFEVVLTHEIGRIAGPIWVLGWILYYIWFRKRNGLPAFSSLDHRWEEHQMEILESAEEYDLLEQYRIALAERDEMLEKRGVKSL